MSGREPTFLLQPVEFFERPAWQRFLRVDMERIRGAAERVARSEGLEVVDVEWKVGKQRFLRVYIDKPESPANATGASISHRDCEVVSQQLSVILDVEDLVPGPGYVLEVSSPGLDRKLTKPSDYQRFAGRRARISMAEPVENTKFFEGRLAGYSDGMVQIEVKGRVIALPWAGIRKANLVVEF
jgi:ribosome maturation factor RimP